MGKYRIEKGNKSPFIFHGEQKDDLTHAEVAMLPPPPPATY
jgi:hypothetical protein